MIGVVILGALCASGGVGGQEPRLYVVGPSDVLTINVYGDEKLSGKYTVEGDGTFTFPFLGRLKVGGLDLAGVESSLRNALRGRFLKDPQVSVAVDQYRSQQIFILGEVKNPGTLEFRGSMTLIEALARVGSTTDRAGAEALVYRRPKAEAPADVTRPNDASDPDTQVIRVSLEQGQLREGAASVPLVGGDTLFVPSAETVFVSGQVASTGEYPIRKDMTVRQAVALAGGITDRGSEGRIQIIRKVNGKETKLDAKLQDLVKGGDTIVVRERWF